MKKERRGSKEEKKSPKTIEDQLAYINETIKESENEDSVSSKNQENASIGSDTLRNSSQRKQLPSEKEESGSEIERRECDCCREIPDEIINMNCVHNICVNCTLSVSSTSDAGSDFSGTIAAPLIWKLILDKARDCDENEEAFEKFDCPECRIVTEMCDETKCALVAHYEQKVIQQIKEKQSQIDQQRMEQSQKVQLKVKASIRGRST